MEDKTYVVQMPCITEVDETSKMFESLGFTDCTPKGKDSVLLKLTMRYWVFSLAKKAFVGSSKTFGNEAMTVEEFLNMIRGTLAGKKFGI